jgi:hypothetical protein
VPPDTITAGAFIVKQKEQRRRTTIAASAIALCHELLSAIPMPRAMNGNCKKKLFQTRPLLISYSFA